ncbi:MAG: glycoside hydrolase family 3 C-terminal domain-containing protein [Fimbriimonadia bacterium]|jgi:beta-glucosidase
MARWQDPTLTIDQRVEDLLCQMTLEEKVSQMMHEAAEIPRLGVPAYNWWNECLHGVAWAGNATVFPQAIGMAATWDEALILRVAEAISDEARAKHHDAVKRNNRGIFFGLTYWSPNINIFRDPRWGRGQETWGEDPYLTGKLASAFVRGLQGNDPKYLKLVSTPKHYAVHSGPEPLRHEFDAVADEYDLHDTYLPAFRETVVEAKAHSVMSAYNSINGEPASANRYLMELLRKDWGFEGYVVSDCGAIHDIFTGHKFTESAEEAAAVAVKAGTDLNCGGTYAALTRAVEQGLITETELDVALRRLLTARFRLGMFDPDEKVPYAQIPMSVVCSPKHRMEALRTARESIVLLKNDGLLPLCKGLGTIAVIGPNADVAQLGNYSGTPVDPVTPLAGICAKVSADTKILYAKGCRLTGMELEPVPTEALIPAGGQPGQTGLLGEYFANRDLQGEPALTRLDETVNFDWETRPPDSTLPKDHFSVRWTGKLKPPVSGEYDLAFASGDGFRMFLDRELLVEDWTEHSVTTSRRKVHLEAGREYDLRIEYFEHEGQAAAKLLWAVPSKNLLAEAVDAAKRADVAIVCVGLSPELEGEELRLDIEGFYGGDRTSLDLPKVQQGLLEGVHATGTPVVVVLIAGSAVALNWADDHCGAVLCAWYPGEEGGAAIADVIFGDYNPAGRLPVTFYRSVADLPPFDDYSMKGRTYRYFEGEPLYPFGFGLSYTRFAYSDLSIDPGIATPGEPVRVRVTVRNEGDRAGDEVVQLYLAHAAATGRKPLRALAGFRRVHLKPGAEARVEFVLGPRELSRVDETGSRWVEAGGIQVFVGGRQPDEVSSRRVTHTGMCVGALRIEGERMLLSR